MKGDVQDAQRFALVLAVGLAVLAVPEFAQADEPHFGQYDIPTIFFISKSDDHNRVDYGLRLDSQCHTIGSDSLFPYWREFEHAPPVRTHALGMFEYFAYGISDQSAVHTSEVGGQYFIKLKRFRQRPIWIDTKLDADGRCSALARCRIAGVPFAQLLSIYVKLSGPLSVAYVVVKGRNLKTRQLIEERLTK